MKAAFWAAGLLAVGFVGMSVAQAAPTDDWQVLYEADKKPGDSGSIIFTRYSTSVGGGSFNSYGTPAVSSTDGNEYTFNSINLDGGAYFYIPAGYTGLYEPSSATGYTMEFRVKVADMDVADNDPQGFQIQYDEGTSGVDKFWFLNLFKNSAGNYQAVLRGASSTNQVLANIDNTAFHTYRVTVLNDTATLYLDNALVGSTTGLRNLATDQFAFGDMTGPGDSSVVVDYLRINDLGAFAPTAVPEPAALGLLAAGGVWSLRRRKD